jgi:hypothetical protein
MMQRISGWVLFVLGLSFLAAVTYIFIAVRAGAVHSFPNSWVWPFFAGGILLSVLLIEAGRAMLSVRYLFLLEILAVSLAILWYALSGS